MTRSAAQSAQRYPLTEMLGSEANVRLLRELSRYGGQLSAPDLVSRTGLAKATVRIGLMSLERAGVVSVAGSGRAHLYAVQARHPLYAALDSLFEAEERRFEAVLQVIREAAHGCGPELVAAWLYGSVARGEDRLGGDLDIAVVASEDALEMTLAAMRGALRPAGEAFGFAPSVVGLGTNDVARLAGTQDPWWAEIVRDAFVLDGPRPDELARLSRVVSKGQTAA
jgi:predicted nucleotidyltransferase